MVLLAIVGKRREFIIVTLLLLVIVFMTYQMWQTNRQIGQLILTNRELVGTQRLLISDFSESYNILADCTILLEEKNCDQVIDGQRLERLKTEKGNLIEQMNKLDSSVEDIIEGNGWAQYAEDIYK